MPGRNRKSHNPLTRVYESNGPDVKIRGTATHVAEKYLHLARGAQSSGDPVGAENYFQHAEHYFRLIATAQEQFRQTQPNAPFYRPERASSGNDSRDEVFDDSDDDGAGAPEPQPAFSGGAPQPAINNLCFPTVAAPSYGPDDKCLVSATVVGTVKDPDHVLAEVHAQLGEGSAPRSKIGFTYGRIPFLTLCPISARRR